MASSGVCHASLATNDIVGGRTALLLGKMFGNASITMGGCNPSAHGLNVSLIDVSEHYQMAVVKVLLNSSKNVVTFS